ncbi:MAG: hypothetical protein R3B70_18420 [Polyangiaceae bacterium]
MRNQAFKILGNLHVVVAGPNPPTDAEWHTYVEAVKAEEQRGLDLTEMTTLVITEGGGPNAAQRKMVNDVLRGRTTKVATVSGSPFFRGIVTALTWFNPEMRVFSPDNVTDAFRFLGIPESQYDEIWEEIELLRLQLEEARSGGGESRRPPRR